MAHRLIGGTAEAKRAVGSRVTIATMSDALKALERLRRLRSQPSPDTSIAELVAATARDATRTHKRLGALIQLWEALVPKDLANHTRVSAIRGGVGHVVVDSAATAYELDRHLRGGLEDQIRQRYPATLIRIRVTVGNVSGQDAPISLRDKS